ncbi:MAG: Polysaccharide biosynthesis protein [Parcubacteria group bacterium GW2011_GWB1_38_8]|nr:MAG: Polysaccharide biosynthesis protein [Parcubacteria group bacterium GW2011_GWB1_38_8]
MQNLRSKIYGLLRYSEQFFKTDMVYLTKGGTWLSFGHGVAMLSGFGLSIAFANLFPKESFGTYKFILSVVGILGALSLTGLGTAIIQATARNFGGILNQSFRINLKWSVGIFIGGIILGTYYYINGDMILSFSLQALESMLHTC